MNQLVSTLRNFINQRLYPQKVVVFVSSATYSPNGTEGVLSVTRTATGTCTISMPLAADYKGRSLLVIDSGNNAATNNITLNRSGSNLLDGSASFVMSTSRQRVMWESDGSNWYSI